MMISDGSALINVRRIDVKVLDENGVKYSVEG
jgi:hypothetical protein